MASMDSICARLCLLTRYALKEGSPAPFSRPTVNRMVRCGALEGLALRQVPGIEKAQYERAEALLARSADVYALVQEYTARGYRVILPQDDPWPVNLYAMGIHMPQFLFVKGNEALLSRRCVAVAGSRKIQPETKNMACRLGEQLAEHGYAAACGGADGVDDAMQRGLLGAGGSLMLVPARPIRELLRQDYLSEALAQGRLLIVCDTWPNETFSAKKALTRNHTIYALGDAALVVASRKDIGGSWRGAMDCLRGGYTPVFAYDAQGDDFCGNHALADYGVRLIPPDKPVSTTIFSALEELHADKA